VIATALRVALLLALVPAFYAKLRARPRLAKAITGWKLVPPEWSGLAGTALVLGEGLLILCFGVGLFGNIIGVAGRSSSLSLPQLRARS